ncbi:MAG: glycerophosphodiester phosphodiesterase family protein [Gemmataceae bacterium]
MSGPQDVSPLVGAAWRDFRRAWVSLVAYEAGFKLLETWLIAPVIAVGLSGVLSRAGHDAVSNRDLLAFLLTPTGGLYAALVGTAAVVLLLVEQAGVMALADRAGVGGRPTVRRAVLAGPAALLRVTHLGAVQVAVLALTLTPFVLSAAAVYGLLLSAHDINYYLADRPPAFWLAVGVGAVLGLAAVVAGTALYVRWAFALPVLLFERQPAGAAIRASRERVRGAGWRVGTVLVGWQLVSLLLGATVQAGVRSVAAVVLEQTGDRPAVVLALLAVQGGLLAAVAFVAVVGLALLTRRLYLARSEQLAAGRPGGAGLEPPPAAAPAWAKGLAGLLVAAGLLVPLAAWVDLPRRLAARPPVRVTAHRGHSKAAPENTLSAVRKAIESGADYAEIDVQLTADGAAVLLHDRDLKRVAGDPRRIDDVTLADARALDVGGWFGPAFAGERVPTLAEVIDLARGRIKLNIELKFYGPDLRLAREVARVVAAKGFAADCLVTSFRHDALVEVRRASPGVRTGLIVAAAVGDVTRLEGDALSVRADWLTDDLLRQAHRRGMEVHVWTVDDERQMVRLMKRGVDNVITGQPDLAVRVRDEWAGRTGAERLALAARVLLGLAP